MTIVPPRPRMSSRHYIAGGLIAGKYELVRPLGEGGMGSVWLAKNVALDSVVALKLLRAELDAEDAGERLLQEARAAARLGHRAIVRVFDFGHTDHGDPFLVMELLEGQSLADIMSSRGRLSPVKAVQTLLPVADALAVAHENGIVHRDLKPENIFLAREARRTQPKVVDFGIAKMEGTVSRALTQQGTVLGSPGYMSPEQARGLSGIDHRADIWAFCVVLYEAITGTLAFEGENYNAIMRSIVEDEVVPSIDLAAGDAALWEIIERGLKKNRDQRWPTMRDLGAALARWLLSHAIEQDVCGDTISTWLEDADAPKSRDILSVPPPSLLGSPDIAIPPPPRTLVETPRQSVPSFRPSAPESTAAMVRSGAPARARQSSFLAVAGILAVGAVVAVTIVSHRESSRGEAAASSVGAAPVPQAEARLAAPSVGAASSPQAEAHPPAPPLEPAGAGAAAPSPPVGAVPAAVTAKAADIGAPSPTVHTKRAAAPTAAKQTKRAPEAPPASRGLKDPY